MQLVMKPKSTTSWSAHNLYGDILSDICAGLTGGLGVAPGATLERIAVSSRPRSTPKYAGQNRANPSLHSSPPHQLEYLEHERGRREDAEAWRRPLQARGLAQRPRGSAGTRSYPGDNRESRIAG